MRLSASGKPRWRRLCKKVYKKTYVSAILTALWDSRYRSGLETGKIRECWKGDAELGVLWGWRQIMGCNHLVQPGCSETLR